MLDTIDNPFLQAPTTLRPCIWLLGLFFLVSSCSLNIIPHFSLLLWVTAPYPCVISMQSSHLSFSFPAVLTWLPVATSSRTHFVCVPHLVSFRTITLFKVLQLAPLSSVYRCPSIGVYVLLLLLQHFDHCLSIFITVTQRISCVYFPISVGPHYRIGPSYGHHYSCNLPLLNHLLYCIFYFLKCPLLECELLRGRQRNFIRFGISIA